MEARHRRAADRRGPRYLSDRTTPKWHGVIGDATYADAILDRLVHNAQRVDLTGDGAG